MEGRIKQLRAKGMRYCRFEIVEQRPGLVAAVIHKYSVLIYGGAYYTFW